MQNKPFLFGLSTERTKRPRSLEQYIELLCEQGVIPDPPERTSSSWEGRELLTESCFEIDALLYEEDRARQAYQEWKESQEETTPRGNTEDQLPNFPLSS